MKAEEMSGIGWRLGDDGTGQNRSVGHGHGWKLYATNETTNTVSSALSSGAAGQRAVGREGVGAHHCFDRSDHPHPRRADEPVAKAQSESDGIEYPLLEASSEP